ncbi:ADP-ribosylglycohydrolase family protein [Phytoactinopolyspora alkaliphila]|uniref:ADP-ribosylglycohydrolase family protein n=1 Tax=Phytoactinopolyspora alkaliphila TaxID=1783498 RepID=A0A6N9YRF1_9ACTN|nr:ADP-ribosylglycohydrolase family protein [Phytoactinopolyspora alkaliphila]NED97408.1 ADP-ribosylglycohydrolase family protein [Phytoactinopolyspora alkaliphila]
MTDDHRSVLQSEGHGARSAGRNGRDGALLGLAIGDAAGWPARQHRSQLLPSWTRRLRRELDTFAETQSVTSLPVAFALNQDPGPLRFGPSDDAEWAAWTLTWLRAAGPGPTRDDVHAAWIDAVAAGRLPRGRISVATAADALRRGARPPRTGYENPHHFDDAAAVRAVAIGAWFPSPDEAAEVAQWDAEVTNAGDGVLAARAVARTIARTIATPTDLPRDALLAELPEATLIGRNVRRALTAVDGAGSPAEAVPLLDEMVDRVYSYGTAAAQTVAVAAALAEVSIRCGGPPIEAVTAAACLPSLADSAPGLAGALVGAVRGAGAFPESWTGRCRVLAGCCAPELAGADVMELMKGHVGEH